MQYVEDQESVGIGALSFGAASCGRGDEEDAHGLEICGQSDKGWSGWMDYAECYCYIQSVIKYSFSQD